MKKKITNGVLLLIVLILWVRIGLDFGKTVNPNPAPPVSQQTVKAPPDLEDLKPYRYTNRRDIFRKPDHPKSKAAATVQLVKPRKKRKPKINASLDGVLGQQDNLTAIVRISSQPSYLSVNDSTEIGVVSYISQDSIVFSQGSSDTLILSLKNR